MNKRNYKSNIFSMLLEDRKNCLEVYNALNNSNYTDVDAIELVKLEEGIALTVRDDAAFMIANFMNIYEHQSTYNPNMPLRCLIYFVEHIKPAVLDKDIYSTKLINIPNPRFVVFYNGKQKRPEFEEMLLSTSFNHKDDKPWLEARCQVYNINHNNNCELLDKCPILKEYMIFVDRIRELVQNGIKLDDAIEDTIHYCIEHNVLYDLLTTRGNEVRAVAALDYTFERREELIKKEYLNDGIEQGIEIGERRGIEIGERKTITKLISKGLSYSEISELLDIPEDDINKLINQ